MTHPGAVLAYGHALAGQSPNPLSIRTVADLGHHLRLLRLRAPRPNPTDDPMTLRALAARSQLPVSTLSHAESGRILPRTEVVYRVAQACGVTPDELPQWIEARQRAMEDRSRPARAVAPARIRNGQLVSTADRATLIEEMPPALAATYLGSLPAQIAADHLTDMNEHAAAERLAAMLSSPAAECLGAMAPMSAATLLQIENPFVAAEQLQAITEPARRAVLAALPVGVAAQYLANMSGQNALEIASGMPAAWKTTLLTTTTVPTAFATELLFTARFAWAIAVLHDMPTERAASVLATMQPDPAHGMLVGLPAPRAAELLTAMPRQRAVLILGEASNDDLVRLLDPLGPAEAARYLSAMPDPHVVAYLESCRTRRGVQILLQLRTRRLTGIVSRLRSDLRAAYWAAPEGRLLVADDLRTDDPVAGDASRNSAADARAAPSGRRPHAMTTFG